MAEFYLRPSKHRAAGDQYMDAMGEERNSLPATSHQNPLDSEEARKEHRQLLSWFYYEREKQAANRMEMAMDADFYDNQQWDPTDAATVKSRGQMPLVYNEVAPMADWLIGTERRTKVDWRVLPRAEDDVELADVKTNVLKYVSDVNRVPFVRSRAFADAVKSGVGWVDDGARDDPTQDILYSRYEDWRNVLWDSASYELDLSDSRYLFRWRWVDEDMALLMFPERRAQILAAMEDADAYSVDPEEDTWYLGQNLERSGVLYASGAGVIADAKRRRIKLIECQFRKPSVVKIVADGPFRGAFFNPKDSALSEHVARDGSTIIDKLAMRVHIAVFTEAHLLSLSPSIYRHNRFSLTPIWGYRRGRDRLPYGAIRRVRDIQQDLNKRASKALFMLNTNQIIATKDAVTDWDEARDEADRPDGVITYKKGEEFRLQRDTDAATGQIQMMTLAAQSIQKTAGVNNENLGRATNAVSGAAIEARQQQGAVGTTEFFDNHRLAVQIQGEKQTSLTEQFYTEEKVVRLTGAKNKIEWLRINQPEIQPDGSVRWLNDITASAADFVVSEADYAGTLRQVMFDSLNQIAGRLPPEVAIRFLRIAFEFSDMPNKDVIAEELRKLTGERDPNKEMTPEEMQQQEQQMAAQAEAMQFQREQAMLALEEGRAKVRKLNAEADVALAGKDGAGEGVGAEAEAAIRQLQNQAAKEIDALSDALRKAQAEAANKIMAVRSDADTQIEIARIDASSRERVAEIENRAAERLGQLEKQMADIARVADEAKKVAEKPSETVKPEATEPAVQPSVTNITVSVDAKTGAVKKEIKLQQDAKGNITGGEVTETPVEGGGKE